MLILVQSPYLQHEIEPGKSLEMQFFILKNYLKETVAYLQKCSLLNCNIHKSLLLLLGHNATHYKVTSKYCVS
jgi:hypothetical protein